MITIPGYKIDAELYISAKAAIYRGQRVSDNTGVVIKLQLSEYPSQAEIANFKHEFALLEKINISNVVKVYALEKVQHRYAMIMEDVPGAVTLQDFMKQQKIDFDLFFTIAETVAAALHEIHSLGIVHKDINPNNIILTPDATTVKIIDFNIATELSQENQELKSAESLEGTLSYISPEQTSRINRSVDCRSDLYSLGVTLYQLLTGKLPFQAKDAVEWVHCHIAKQPKPLETVKADIPKQLSLMVLKLLAKNPEDRYNTAFGLLSDLQLANASWMRKRTIEAFPLGQNDRSSLFQIPQKLYGRVVEVEQLISAFGHVARGGRNVLLVYGYSGVGKSSLVNEIHKPIVKQRGLFAAGKFEQFQQNTPYYALIQALRSLIRQILSSSKDSSERWAASIGDAIIPNGQLIIDVIPELESLIGEQPPVSSLPPSETKSRFELVFFDFVRVFGKAEHPVVLFVDDVQWVDIASLEMLKQFLLDESFEYILVIMSFRDNEVQEGHPFLGLIADLEQNQVPIERLEVKPLDLANVKKLIQDTLHTQLDIEPLAQLVMEKTGGNPFFVNSTLKMFHEEQFIRFNIDRGEWIWQMDKLQSVEITENVVDLVVKKIGKLEADCQQALKIAACIGNHFRLGTLAYMLDQSTSQVAKLIWPALELQLVIPLSQDYKLAMADEAYEAATDLRYKFSHDRVQQAAMQLFDDETLASVKLKLARLMLENTREEQLDEVIFEIVNNYNANLDRITTPEERQKVADLNLRAGHKAKNSVAYDTAQRYFLAVSELLGESAWESSYTSMFEARLAYTECVHLTGDFEKADQLFVEIIEKAQTDFDKARALGLQALSYAIQLKRPESINAGLAGAGVLGFHAKPKPSMLKVTFELMKTMFTFRGKKLETLIEIPTTEDPEKILLLDTIERITTQAYIDDRNLMVVMGLRSLRYVLKEGYTAAVPPHYVLYSLILIGGFRRYQRAYEFSKLADQISQRFDDARMRTQTIFMINVLVYPWCRPYRQCFEQLNNAYDLGRQSGELIYSCFSAALMPTMMVLMGSRLTDVVAKLNYVAPLPEHVGNTDSQVSTHTWASILPVLRGEEPIEHFHQRLKQVYENSIPHVTPASIGVTTVICLMSAYLMEDWDNVAKLDKVAKPHAESESMDPLFVTPEFFFFHALYHLSQYTRASRWQKRAILRRAKRALKKFKLWSTTCKENFEAKYQLVRGGVYYHQGKISQAMDCFERCLLNVRSNDLLLVEAVANEFIGKLLMESNHSKAAKLFLQEALLLYNHWGSGYKVKLMQNRYPALLVQSKSAKHSTSFMSTTMTRTGTITTSTHSNDSGLDMLSIMKSTQALSGEVDWEKLVHALIEIAIENAGASRGILILNNNDKLMVVAKCDSPDEESEILQNTTMAEYGELCQSLVNYVKNSQVVVTLDNAAEQGDYVDDPYVCEKKPLSIAAIPIMNKGEFKGVLYLENNLTTNAFPESRIEVLKAFAAQSAISIENSQLYSAYSQFVPHEFLDLLKKRRIIDVQVGDNVEMDMSVLFCDIRKFTTLSEKLTPEENFQFINEYMRYMEPNIRQQGGFIDKFIGDAIMALYPQSTSDGAILSAIAMQVSLQKYNEVRESRNEPPIFIGLGVNFGTLVLGTVGAQYRMDTTVIGDTVNAASRLEGLTKVYATPVLISQPAYDAIANPDLFNIRFVDRVQVRGKESYFNVWEVYSEEWDPNAGTKKAISGHYTTAVDCLIKQNYKEALDIFKRCHRKMPDDNVLALQVERCEAILRGELEPINFIHLDTQGEDVMTKQTKAEAAKKTKKKTDTAESPPAPIDKTAAPEASNPVPQASETPLHEPPTQPVAAAAETPASITSLEQPNTVVDTVAQQSAASVSEPVNLPEQPQPQPQAQLAPAPMPEQPANASTQPMHAMPLQNPMTPDAWAQQQALMNQQAMPAQPMPQQPLEAVPGQVPAQPMPQQPLEAVPGQVPAQPMPQQPLEAVPGQVPGQPVQSNNPMTPEAWAQQQAFMGQQVPPGQPLPGYFQQPMPGQPLQAQPPQPMPGQPLQAQPPQPMPGQPLQAQPPQPMPGQPLQAQPPQPVPDPAMMGQAPLPQQPVQPAIAQPMPPQPGETLQPLANPQVPAPQATPPQASVELPVSPMPLPDTGQAAPPVPQAAAPTMPPVAPAPAAQAMPAPQAFSQPASPQAPGADAQGGNPGADDPQGMTGTNG